MSISKKDVQHIARLARIAITDEETAQYEKELSGILAFVGQLNEVDTEHVTPMTGGTMLENVERPDEQVDASLEGHAEKLITAFPERDRRRLRVRAIFQ